MTRLGQGADLRTRDCRADQVANEQPMAVITHKRTLLWLPRLDPPRRIQSLT
jgi:hypothetical protein